MSKTRVFLVDDHTMVRQGLALLLDTQKGIEVVGESDDRWRSIKEIKELMPDIVVIDLEMAGTAGVISEIVKISRGINVIVITRHNNDEYIYHVLKAGASGCMLRDSSVSDFIFAIKAVENGGIYLSSLVLNIVLKKLYNVSGGLSDTNCVG